MVYLITSNGTSLCVIEQGNVDQLIAGKPMITPDDRFVLAFTADMEWTRHELLQLIVEHGQPKYPNTMDRLTRILEQGAKRK